MHKARTRRSRRSRRGAAAGALLGALLAGAPRLAQGQAALKGEWSAPFAWPNVGIHLHVLPDGRVLFWGRREWRADGRPAEGLDPRNCVPRIWDPRTGAFAATPPPGFNLFCSGHTFLPDGRLLVAGGHVADGQGEARAAVYDPAANAWAALPAMNAGRWYPTAVTLAGGGALVSSGATLPGQMNNPVQQVFAGGGWRSIVDFQGLPLYPRLHVGPDGRVFMAGPLKRTQRLDTAGGGQWSVVGDSLGPQREEGTSVLYDAGKVLLVGGGNPPLATAEVIDLNRPQPAWTATGSMRSPRRHHNATLLPDGTVLVTGGTAGVGPPDPFNDLSKPVRDAELWDPATGAWATLAAEAVPRLYHSAAVLLPDGRVLSTGGGEYRLPGGAENDPKDSRRDAQLFSPPYLFRGGPRPAITAAPAEVAYGQAFDVGTATPGLIRRVSWVRLSSVTHGFNQTQRLNFLAFAAGPAGLRVTAPAGANQCPPGHYMLFLLDQKGVPSVAKIVRIR